jgi:hypothetical protein
MLKRDEIADSPSYRDLALERSDAAALFEWAGPIDAELDRYLSP